MSLQTFHQVIRLIICKSDSNRLCYIYRPKASCCNLGYILSQSTEILLSGTGGGGTLKDREQASNQMDASLNLRADRKNLPGVKLSDSKVAGVRISGATYCHCALEQSTMALLCCSPCAAFRLLGVCEVRN